jgi:hypothetical protein
MTVRLIAERVLSAKEQALLTALQDCARRHSISPEHVTGAFSRLVHIPGTLLWLEWRRRGFVDMGGDVRTTTDHEALLDLLCLDEGKRRSEVSWRSVSPAERRRAKNLGKFVDSEATHRKGRPIKVDVPLILYIAFTLEATTGRKFRISRPDNSRPIRPPGGPMFRALMAGLALHMERAPKPESVVDILRVTKTDRFRRLSETLGLPRHAAAVETRPNEFILVVGQSRGT